MIRINLLPQQRRVERQEGSQAWLAVILALLLAEVAGFFVWHGQLNEELETKARTNRELTNQIDQSKRAVANHAEVKTKLEELRARENAINQLQTARTGPTATPHSTQPCALALVLSACCRARGRRSHHAHS